MKLKNLKNIIKEKIEEIQLMKQINEELGEQYSQTGKFPADKARGAEYWAQHPEELARRLNINVDDVPEHLAFWQAKLEAEGCKEDLTKVTDDPAPSPRRR